MTRRIGSLLLAITLAAAPAAGAQHFVASSTGLLGPARTVDFNSGSVNGGVGTLNGVTFSNLWFGDAASHGAAPFNGGAMSAFNFLMSQTGIQAINPISMMFGYAVQGAAFELISFPGTATFTAYLNGNVVNSFTASSDLSGMNAPTYYGFDNTVTLDRIDVSMSSGNLPDIVGIDNVQVGVTAAPEPASLALLATGLIGLAGVARRRSKKA